VEKWEKMLAVQHIQDFIEKHLKDNITMSMLAKAAGYSQWHSARLFKKVTGKTPFDYVRALRLSRVAVRLHDEDVRIIDVAFDFVFDSYEGFTMAFSREFGMTPRYYAKNIPPLKLFLPAARDYYFKLQKGEYEMSENTNTVFVQVVDRTKRKMILKRGIKAAHYFEYCEEVGCKVWDELSAIKEAIYEPIGMWLPEKMTKPGTSKYAQGVEVPADYRGKAPEGYEIIDLAPCKMMVFQGAPYDDAKFEQAIGDLWEVMNRYNPEIYGFQWADDDGPRFQLAPMGYRGYIEARPVRQVNV